MTKTKKNSMPFNQVNLCSWNINGLRAVLKKGFLTFIEQGMNGQRWDIIALQEIKISKDQLPQVITQHKDYHLFCAHAKKPGYSGVALLIHKSFPIEKVVSSLGIDKFDSEGRTLILESPYFTLINGYYPNGQRDHGRVDFKLEYSDEILNLAKTYRKKTSLPIILTGDFNTAHREIDLANPKTNQKTTGFLPRERAWIDKLIANGHVDTFRHFSPEQTGHYTWWTYRNQCRERNIGWRIDYFFIDDKSIEKVQAAQIHPEILGSDHCPVSLQLKL